MALREDKMGQCQLLPTSIKDLIPVDHIVNLVIAVVNTIDISEMDERYMDTPGNPAYLRRMLLRVLVQSAIDGVFSSRKIAGSVVRMLSTCISQGVRNQIIERYAGSERITVI